MRIRLSVILAATVLAAAGGTAQGPRKINVAHRGASAYAPEHTLAAYRLALEQGADFVEQDLAVTRDGVLICLHDPSLERTTDVEERFPERASEVVVAGKPRRVWLANDFTLAEIKTLDAGSWFSPAFAGERVPTFDEAVALIRGKAGLYPELKTPEIYQGRDVDFVAIVERGPGSAWPAWSVGRRQDPGDPADIRRIHRARPRRPVDRRARGPARRRRRRSGTRGRW